MLTLSAVNTIASEMRAAEGKAERAKRLLDRLYAIRIGDKPLMVAYKALGNWDTEVQSAIESIVNELGADLLRTLELRQEAFAARCAAEAAAKRLQLGTIVDLSEAA